MNLANMLQAVAFLWKSLPTVFTPILSLAQPLEVSFHREFYDSITVGANPGFQEASAALLVLFEMVSTLERLEAGGADVNLPHSVFWLLAVASCLVPGNAGSADKLAAVVAEHLSSDLTPGRSHVKSEDVEISDTQATYLKCKDSTFFGNWD